MSTPRRSSRAWSPITIRAVCFAVSFRVFITITGVPALLGTAALPLLSRAARDDPDRLAYITRRFLDVSLAGGIGVALVLSAGAPFIVSVIAGTQLCVRANGARNSGVRVDRHVCGDAVQLGATVARAVSSNADRQRRRICRLRWRDRRPGQARRRSGCGHRDDLRGKRAGGRRCSPVLPGAAAATRSTAGSPRSC